MRGGDTRHPGSSLGPEPGLADAGSVLVKAMEAENGLVHAYLLDGKGGGRRLDWAGVRAWKPADGPLWVHLDMLSAETESWVRNESGLAESDCDLVLAEATRPQTVPMDDGLLVVLRGVNLNPGAEPDDMVALRAAVEPTRLVTLRRRVLRAVADTVKDVEAGNGPEDVPDLLLALAGHLLERMAPTLEELGDAIDQQEEDAVLRAPRDLQADLAELRRQVIALRRHLAPQREAMVRLTHELGTRFGSKTSDFAQLLTDQIVRHVEDLDELRERAAVVQDLLAGRQADAMNQRMMLLSVITAIFLPLGLITGLLGINVGGIPGSGTQTAFLIVCGLLVALAVVQVIALRLMKWF